MKWFRLAVLLPLFCAVAGATAITYTEQTTASGYLGGTQFEGAQVTVVLIGDTSTITNSVGVFWNQGTATLTIAVIPGTATFTDTMMEAFDVPTYNEAGIGDLDVPSNVLATWAMPPSPLGSYELATAIGPVAGTWGPGLLCSSLNFPTSAGTFQLACGSGLQLDTTFTATLGASGATELGSAAALSAEPARDRSKKGG